MDSLKPMLLTSLKSYDKSQFFKDVTAGIIVAIIALPLSIALALASGVGPEAGIFHRNCSRICNLCSRRKQCTDCRSYRCICNHRRRYRRQKWYGRSHYFNHSRRYFSHYYGIMPLWKSDQIHSIYDYNWFHFRYRSYDCNRSVKGFLWNHLSEWRNSN